jgi:hypothetical protein
MFAEPVPVSKGGGRSSGRVVHTAPVRLQQPLHSFRAALQTFLAALKAILAARRHARRGTRSGGHAAFAMSRALVASPLQATRFCLQVAKQSLFAGLAA